ncbi:acetolactate synthase large subunit [Marinicella sp. S1101]|uniref:acetolactate synthase large subunit n=1 Tax=Marinicella marina TaxID=2996016 RepID=UPI002260D8B3|nr:acetolactate synthase large subunit [Marinicella marina]MCX7553636.1 acetolactate synthase large subunit [Marinicella marina]MDJ1140260.1 acetolactate synthase large subunit [Marinicella marina]
MSNAAQVLIRSLEAFDVTHVFGVPGEETLDLLAALKDSAITFIPCRHEQSATIMAANMGRLTGVPGVSLTTLGPGALNAINGVAYAYLGQMPLLVVSGQKPVRQIKQGNFQMLDVVEAMQPVTLMSQRLMKADSTPSVVYHLLNTATDHTPGPVHLELAEDIAHETVSDAFSDLKSYQFNPNQLADDKAINDVVERINAANKPLLILGQHAQETEVAAQLKNLVQTTNMPFATTQMGKGAVDERIDQYMGTTALSSDDFVHEMAAAADLLIMVGHNESEKPPLMACGKHQELIHISTTKPALNDTYFPDWALIGDMAHTIQVLGTQLKPLDESPFTTIKQAFDDHEVALMTSAHPVQIIQQVRQALPSDAMVTLDNGMYKIWFTRHYRAHIENSLLLDNALATMGAGLPAAIACQLVYPERPVLAVCGDGGFVMGGQDFETAVRLNLNLVVLILRDDQFGMIRWKQEMDGFDDYGLDFGNPDFAAMADSFGAKGHRIDDVSALGDCIGACVEQGGVHLIEMGIDYAANSLFNDLAPVVKQAIESID